MKLVRGVGNAGVVVVVWLILELLLRCGWCGAPTIENVGRWKGIFNTFRGHEAVSNPYEPVKMKMVRSVGDAVVGGRWV